MDSRLRILFLLSTIPTAVFCTPKTVSPGSTPRSAQPIVYTAETARQLDPPSPSSKPQRTTDPYGPSATGSSVDIPDDSGFVEPIDFNAFVANFANDRRSSTAPSPFASESKTKDAFQDFFKSGSTERSYFDPDFGALSSSASSHNARKPNEDSEDGFVDPTVQFRSLFDSTETADGFRPQDFLNYKGESVGAEPSKGSQTQAFPSYTYSGRQNGDSEDYEPASTPKYRSSYRQVDSRERSRDPYDDRNYYDGERDESPPPPRPPPRRYQVNGNNRNSGEAPGYAPTGQETAQTPQTSNSKPKGAESSNARNPKCKKVEKVVDDEEDYENYNQPSPDYDPSTYDSRYKRQAGRSGGRGGNRKGSNKKPMTCFVCEDEQGRYAERCSYDSNSDPSKGSYFHSSSTSFNDNGNKRGNRGRERHRRNPTYTASESVLLPTTAIPSSESLPKKIEKRQSQGNRYASDFRDGGDRRYNSNNDDHEDFDIPAYGGQSNERDPDRNTNDYEGPPLFTEHRGARGGGGGGRRTNNRDDDNNDYGFAPPSTSTRRNNRPRQQGSDFEFGPPSDFGRDNGEDSKGFEFDFSVPKDFQNDANLGTSNTNNRPIFSGSNGNAGEFGPDASFDVGYDDYIKQYFPEAFGSTPSPGGSASHRPSGVSSSPERHHSNSPPRGGLSGPSYQGSGSRPPLPGFNREKQGTNPSHNYSPPPYYDGPEDRNKEHLQQVISTFDQKDRGNCQKVQKGDMQCYVCRDPRGMNKEECMYKSNNDPRNTQMSYHEVSEYSSNPPASILPLPRPNLAPAESKVQEVKTLPKAPKSPLDYDFDY